MVPSFDWRGRGGSFNFQSSVLERTTPSAPAKEASPLFLNGRSHPSFAKLCQGGEFHSDASRHLLKSRLILNSLRSGGLNLRNLRLRLFAQSGRYINSVAGITL